jgi:hypothetical protein
LGLPHPASGRKPDFGCNAQTKTHSPGFVNTQINTQTKKAVFIEKTFANRRVAASYFAGK